MQRAADSSTCLPVLGPFLGDYALARATLGVLRRQTHVLLLDLSLLLGREVVHNVEELADLLRSLALDHVCNSLATDITVAPTDSATPY